MTEAQHILKLDPEQVHNIYEFCRYKILPQFKEEFAIKVEGINGVYLFNTANIMDKKEEIDSLFDQLSEHSKSNLPKFFTEIRFNTENKEWTANKERMHELILLGIATNKLELIETNTFYKKIDQNS